MIIFTLIFLIIPSAFADFDLAQLMTVHVENDVGTIGGPGTDHSYTQGLQFGYVKTIKDVPTWASPFTDLATQSNVGYIISQKLFTPNGIGTGDLKIDDQPYAGWLSLANFYHFKNEYRSHIIELNIGVIGPESGGENMQYTYHKATNYLIAQGWHNQLATEPTLEASYQQRIHLTEKSFTPDNKIFDAFGLYGGDFGNVLIDGYFGAMTRFGFFIPDDDGPARPSLLNGERFIKSEGSNNKFYVYTFASARLVAVGRNIFLDGNTFKPSHRVKKKIGVFENEIGLSVNYCNFNLTWSYVTITPQFDEKDETTSFASVSPSFLF